MKSGRIPWSAEYSMKDCMTAQDVPGLMLSGPPAGSGPPTRALASALRAPATPGGAPADIKEAVVPAYDSLTMTPNGPHLWLTDLKRPLKAGDTITLTLVTDGGVALETKAAVRDSGL